MHFGEYVEFTVRGGDIQGLAQVLVFLLSKKRIVLHEEPFDLTAGGSNGIGGFMVGELLIVCIIKQMVG